MPEEFPGALPVPDMSEDPAAGAATVVQDDADGQPVTHERNRQSVGQGIAVAGSAGPITYNNYYAVQDGEAEGPVAKPRFREGPYPPEDIAERLQAFVEPPTYPDCRKALTDRRVLILSGEQGTGTSTAALALLHDVTGGGRITGLGSDTDLTEWSKAAAGGYLLEGLAPDTGGTLDEVALNRLNEHLREKHAHLVITVEQTVKPPRGITSWCREHRAPGALDVAHKRLEWMAGTGMLEAGQYAAALTLLEDTPFTEYLSAARTPAAGVEAAEEAREVAAGDRTPETAEENLRLGSAEAAAELLKKVSSNADDLALTAALALLEEQDRSVVERFAARLRPLLAQRTGGMSVPPEGDLLGRDIHDRLRTVEARFLPRTVASTRGYRYWTRPVVFRGRHLAEEVLQRLWSDYEGFSDVLMTWLHELPYEPGVDQVAGRRVGRTLCRASGPDVLRRLNMFAHSRLGWQRRLVGYALGEVIQDAVLSTAVRSQLRQWSRSKKPEVRSTVAEACAGSLGLALPDFAFGLLNTVLSGSEEQLGEDVGKSVSAALGILLTEDANTASALKQLTAWLRESAGSARQAYAVDAVGSLCTEEGFPAVNRAGARRLTLAGLFTHSKESLAPLLLEALDIETLHDRVSTALIGLEKSLGPERAAEMDTFMETLTEASGGRRGLRALLLSRYRVRSAAAPSGEA